MNEWTKDTEKPGIGKIVSNSGPVRSSRIINLPEHVEFDPDANKGEIVLKEKMSIKKRIIRFFHYWLGEDHGGNPVPPGSARVISPCVATRDIEAGECVNMDVDIIALKRINKEGNIANTP